jgi:hypothetical protein
MEPRSGQAVDWANYAFLRIVRRSIVSLTLLCTEYELFAMYATAYHRPPFWTSFWADGGQYVAFNIQSPMINPAVFEPRS